MFEWLVVFIGFFIVFILSFLLGCYLTLNSIRQDGIDINLQGNTWKVKERNEKDS